MGTPSWLAAAINYPARPGQINQFLGSHSSAWTYTGNVLQSSEIIGDSVYQSTFGQSMAQTISTTANQTTIGSVLLQLSTVGGSPINTTIPPITIGLYANSNGTPTGSVITSVNLTVQYVYLSTFWVSVPLTATGLTAGTPYQLVITPVGSATNYYVWQQSNQTSGASLSTDGLTWNEEAFGFMYQVYDQSGTIWPPLTLVDDDGARVTTFSYNGTNQLTGISESVVAQDGSSFFSSRTISYSGLLPTGIS